MAINEPTPDAESSDIDPKEASEEAAENLANKTAQEAEQATNPTQEAKPIHEATASKDTPPEDLEPPPLRLKRKSLLRTAVADVSRLGKISAVLARHGFGQVAGQLGLTKEQSDEAPSEHDLDSVEGTARRFRFVLEDLGATFIKLGQILSTRPDIMPPAYIRELSKLQSSVPELDYEVIAEAFQKATGTSVDDAFAHFEHTPLATGSIAQAHVAKMHDGREVVVKIQRPNLVDIMSSDLNLLYALAKMAEATVEEVGLYAPTAIINEFETALLSELDFTIEARNLRTFQRHFKAEPSAWIPDIISELSTITTLVMERIPGVKITELEPGSERAKKIARTLLRYAYKMIFEFGAFHGDPHPGNLLITDDDRIGLIDFGLTGSLSSIQQDTLISLVIAVVSGDTDSIARAVLQMGRPEQRIVLRDLRQDIVDIRGRYLNEALDTIDISAFILDLLEAGQRYRIRISPNWAILGKASVSMEGNIRHLFPELDIASEAQPFMRDLLMQRYGPQALSQRMLAGALGASNFMREIPASLTQVMLDMESGGLRVELQHEALDSLQRTFVTLGTRIALGLLACGFTIGLFISLTPYHPTVYDIPLVPLLAAFCLGWCVSSLWLWHLLEGRIKKIRITPLLRVLRWFKGG